MNDRFAAAIAVSLAIVTRMKDPPEAQARCRHCDVPLDGVSKHATECPYPAEQAEAMRAMTHEEMCAREARGLQNAWVPEPPDDDA